MLDGRVAVERDALVPGGVVSHVAECGPQLVIERGHGLGVGAVQPVPGGRVPHGRRRARPRSRWRPMRWSSVATLRSIGHCVAHTPARYQWSSRRRYQATATSTSPWRDSRDAKDAPAMPTTNEVSVRSASSIGPAQELPGPFDVLVELGFPGAVPGERGEGADRAADLVEHRRGDVAGGLDVAGVQPAGRAPARR